MALNICVEALIRLLLEIINYVFGDITLLFRGHPEAFWTVVLPELLRTIVWIFIFYIIKYLIKVRFLANIIIIGIPLALTAIAGLFSAIPVIGWIFSGAILVTSAILSAIAWGFITITEESAPVYLRLIGLPGMMVLGAIAGAIGPFGILIDMGAVVALSTIASWVIPASTLIVLLLTFWSPTWFCETLNTSLKVIANVRQEGLVEGISQSLMFIPLIKNRIIKIKDKG
jgi:hypothetical protein